MGKYCTYYGLLAATYYSINIYKPFSSTGSRINVIYNFGYVALNIMHLRPEDSGTYTVRATNKAGECQCQASIQVISEYLENYYKIFVLFLGCW